MTKARKMQPERVTAIIPAFNEAQHISSVLSVLRSLDEIDQIIVVDDGSTDTTAEVVVALHRRDERIVLLRLLQNEGKAAALHRGATASKNDLLLLLDADLIGLRPIHVQSLLAPVSQQQCGMAVGVFRNGRSLTDWSHRFAPFLSGQRCLRWSLFSDTPALADARWGVEVAFHLHAWQQGYAIQHVSWPGVTHTMRLEKMDRSTWLHSYLVMYRDIVRYCARHVALPRLHHLWRRSHLAPVKKGVAVQRRTELHSKQVRVRGEDLWKR